MRKKFEEVYVVAKNEVALLSDTIYDFKTATKIAENCKNAGNKDAEVITLKYAYENGYLVS